MNAYLLTHIVMSVAIPFIHDSLVFFSASIEYACFESAVLHSHGKCHVAF